MFMQSIRRATKRHRKVLLVVVILLLLGLVGSFATWSSRSGVDNTGGAVSGEPSLDQLISSYLTYIREKEAEDLDFNGYQGLADTYMDLGSLYQTKLYSSAGDGDDDEEAYAATENAMKNSAAWARIYYQHALDNAPEALNAAGIAEIKNKQAAACDMQGDTESAAAFRKEAISVRIAASLSLIQSLEAEEADYDGYKERASAYMELSYLYANSLTGDEEEDHETQHALEASAASARNCYEQALENLPEDLQNDAAKAEIKFAQAEACDVERDAEGALVYIEEASALAPEDVRYVYSLAAIHQELGNEAKAIMFYQQARAMAPEDLTVAYAYANFLFSHSSPEDGIEELKAYRAALPAGHPYIEEAEYYIEYFQSFADMFASFEMVGDDDLGLEIDYGSTDAELEDIIDE